MKISKKIFCVVSLLLLSTALLLGDFEITHWRYFKPIQTGGAPAKRLVAIRIDNEVIAQSESLDRELRVIEDPAAEIPFSLATDSDEATDNERSKVRVFNKGVREGKYQQFVCDLFVRRALFEFEPGRSYRLFYANAEAQALSYDLTAFQNSLRGKVLTPARLGPQQDNPEFVPAQERKAWSERHPQVLWVVLIVVVIGLGLLVFRGVKPMGKSA